MGPCNAPDLVRVGQKHPRTNTLCLQLESVLKLPALKDPATPANMESGSKGSLMIPPADQLLSPLHSIQALHAPDCLAKGQAR